MKTSFITTVLNEEKTIQEYLDSILSQSRLPSEIIVVDAGSTDKTQSIIKAVSKKTKPPIKLIVKPGLPRSTARNLAVRKARHSIICVSDAGNTLDSDWLERITAPFKNRSVDAVAGYYHVQAESIFQKAVAPFLAVMPDKFNPQTFLPSSRSLAFKKSAWQKVKGYPEPLNTCEDLVFAARLKKQTNLVVEPNAIVHWQQVNNLFQFFLMVKNYAQGDTQSRYQPHLKKIATVFLRYLLFFLFPLLFLFYPLFPLLKHYHYVNHPLAFILLPLLQFTSDAAVILGFFNGIIRSKYDSAI